VYKRFEALKKIGFFRALFLGGLTFEIFSGTFVSRPTPPPYSPPMGDYPPTFPLGDYTPHVGRIFFLNFFFSKIFFILKNRHMGDFFGRLGPDKKYFSIFFLVPTSGGPIFGPLLGPVLDPFWTLWTHFGLFWTILVTLGDYRGHK